MARFKSAVPQRRGRATTAPYLLFVDGDCVLPPNHVAIHLAHRREGRAMLGDCYRIEKELSETLSEDGARRGEFLHWYVNGERERLAHQHFKARLHAFLRHPRKPKLVGNNFGVWRGDFERVNGFDENFCGWGQEDDDLGLRLRRAGVRLDSILGATRSYHLWHPRDPSTTTTWREGINVPYFLRRSRLTCCRNGLVKRGVADLAIRTIGRPAAPDRVAALWDQAGLPPIDQMAAAAQQPIPPETFAAREPEVEILFLPGTGRFSGRAELQVLVALDESPPSARLLGQAHLIVSPRKFAGIEGAAWFPLASFAEALDSIV